MRGSKAKALRRRVYGDLSTREHRYEVNTKTGQVRADDKRRAYQASKEDREWKR